MGKLKLKKKFKIFFVCIVLITLLLIVGINYAVKTYKQKQYEKTYEYKLITIGYTKKEAKTIIKNYKDKEIKYILKQDNNGIYIDIIKEKYFIYDYFYDYLDYIKESKNISIRSAIEKVNTHTNLEYYSKTFKTDETKNELLLVNKYYYLGEDYTPQNLVTIPTTYAWGDAGSQKVTQDTYDAFLELWKDANQNGCYLMVSSSYRTYQRQTEVYNDYKKRQGESYADSIAARPGFSEHQSGYAIDMFHKGTTQKSFHESECYSWLINNAHRYGFILRYPQDKESITGYSFESWHYRYVGVKAATEIYNNHITFDEYYAYYVK